MDYTVAQIKVVNMTKNPLSILWIGRCTIYEYQDVTDPDTYQTKQELTPVVIDEPCRLSLSFVSHNVSDLVHVKDGSPVFEQLIVVFLRPDLIIKPGSVFEITQNARTDRFKSSSKPNVYSNHQEVVLELYEDYA